MKIRKDWYKQKWAQIAIGLCIAILFYLVISHFNVLLKGLDGFFGFVRPIVLGIVFAYIVNPLVNMFEQHLPKSFRSRREKTAHGLAVALGIIVVLVLIVLLLVALIPQLVESIRTFIGNLDEYIAGLQKLVNGLMKNMKDSGQDVTKLSNISDMIFSALSSMMPSRPTELFNFVTNVSTNIFDLVIGIIMAVYFLGDKKRLMNGIKRFLRFQMTEKRYRAVSHFATRCNDILIRYIGGDLIDGFIVGLANFCFMMIMHMPYVALISVVVGVTNLAPTFGPLVGAVIGALILALVNPWFALWFLIFTIVLQTMDGYVIKPKLFGNTLGVSGIWILICIIFGGKAFGVVGILLSIPFAAISDYVYHDLIIRRLAARHEKMEREEELRARNEYMKKSRKKKLEPEDAAAGLMAYTKLDMNSGSSRNGQEDSDED